MKIIHVPKRPAVPKRKPLEGPRQVAPLPSGPERPFQRTKKKKRDWQRKSDVV